MPMIIMTDGNVQENKFGEFKGLYAKYFSAKQAASANDASGRMQARRFATVYFSEMSQLGEVDENTIRQNLARIQQGDQAYVDSLLHAATTTYTERFSNHFKPDTLEEIVSDAPEDKLAKKFLNYQPLKIEGNEWHNERYKIHSTIVNYQMAFSGDEKAMERVQQHTKLEFVEQMVGKLKDKLKGDKDLSDRTREIVVNAMALNYGRIDIGFSEDSMVKFMVDRRDKLVKEFEKMFKDDKEKAQYVRANVTAGAKELMKQGPEGYNKAADMIASIDRE